jgi:hypothetical protein
MPRSLLIRDIHTLVLMDPENTVLRGAYLYIEDGEIRQVGAAPAKLPRADRTIERAPRGGRAGPGEHAPSSLPDADARLRPAADAELFDWLRTLYPIVGAAGRRIRAGGGAGGHGGAAALGLHHHHRSPLPVPARPQPADRRGNRSRPPHRHSLPSHARQHERGPQPGRTAARFGGAKRRAGSWRIASG